MKKIKITDFSLKHTLECGQFFYYIFDEKTYFYYIVNKNEIFKVKQEKDILFYEGISKEKLIYFFSLDIDLKEITKDFDQDKYLLLSLEKYFGMRLIRADFEQCLISFVCSSASNIPKIQKNIFLLSENFGKKHTFDSKTFYTFPNLEDINDIEKIKNSKTGFRSKYILEIAKFAKENKLFFENIKKANYEDSKKMLITLPGIGNKVADCISLFSLNHSEAFPIDTWVKQIIEQLYLKKDAKNLKEIEKYIQKKFTKNKGIKQQYLFHFARNNL